MSDSSFANTTKMRSQCGYIVGLSLPSMVSGDPTPMFHFGDLQRKYQEVCRSTLAAEANGFLSATEAG